MSHAAAQEARLSPGLSGIDLVVANGPEMIEAVRLAQLQANHYGGFGVGALAVASSAGEVSVYTAANQNLYPGDNPTKICAEQVVLAKVDHHGLDRVDALFAAGPVQADTQSGIATPTLHCCGLCRECMARMPKISPDMPVITVHPTRDEFEWNTLGEMLAIHRGQLRPAANAVVDPGFRQWQQGAADYRDWVRSPLGSSVPRSYLARIAVTGRVDSNASAVPAVRRRAFSSV